MPARRRSQERWRGHLRRAKEGGGGVREKTRELLALVAKKRGDTTTEGIADGEVGSWMFPFCPFCPSASVRLSLSRWLGNEREERGRRKCSSWRREKGRGERGGGNYDGIIDSWEQLAARVSWAAMY